MKIKARFCVHEADGTIRIYEDIYRVPSDSSEESIQTELEARAKDLFDYWFSFEGPYIDPPNAVSVEGWSKTEECRGYNRLGSDSFAVRNQKGGQH